jgi:hypothetical protein
MTMRRLWPKTAASFLAAVVVFDLVAFFTPLLLGVKPGKYTKDANPVVWLSVLQLLGTGYLAWRLFRARGGWNGWRAPQVVWAAVAAGFCYLAVDEVARVHENLALLVYRGFDVQREGLAGRLDDLIVASYGLVGMAVLWKYREELRRYGGVMPLLVSGFVCLFLMVVLDLLTHKKDLLPMLIGDPAVSDALFRWLGVTEELFKILSEGLFLTTFWSCVRIGEGWAAVFAGSEVAPRFDPSKQGTSEL